MNYHNYREYTLLENNIPLCDPLESSIKSDYLIIGGGVAGLHTVLELLKQGINAHAIVLVEKSICGGGMSGKSGGFLTPDSELGLRAYERRYGNTLAKRIWDFGSKGQDSIVSTIRANGFQCDLRDQDSLLLGLGKSGIQACIEESHARDEYNLESELITDIEHLRTHISSPSYSAGAKYKDCYGIDSFQYCQSLKNYLVQQGVRVFEFTQIDELKETQAITNCGSVHFKHAFICPGKITPALSPSKAKLLYGIMNFITVSEPLEHTQIQAMMPSGEVMCRDTQLVFTYYRVISGNRIILGGGNPLTAFQPRDIQYDTAIKLVINNFKKMFPSLQGVTFNDYWSGRIEVTKDLMPIIDNCNEHCNHTWVMGCVGLPWAAACGEFTVKRHFGMHDKALDDVFAFNRKWLIDWAPSNSIFKSITFAISNARSMFWQKGY